MRPKTYGAQQSQGGPFRTGFRQRSRFPSGSYGVGGRFGDGLLPLLRPPVTGRSNDRWRRSTAGRARLSVAVMPLMGAHFVRDYVSMRPSDQSPVVVW